MIALLRRGVIGEVWRADDLVLQTAVALKLIHAHFPQGQERVLDEVRVARQITHPAICRVFDVGLDEGRAFYTMELVEGEDLATLVRRAGRLPSERVREIGEQICGGLAAAHARGVLHRNLNSGNVLIDQQGQVRITDFVPEQLHAGERITERTDVYAVGLVLYELLTGREAYPDAGAIRTKLPPRPSAMFPDVDESLEHAILSALALDPRRRPPNAVALGQQLGAVGAERRRRVRGWIAGLALAAVVVTMAVLFSGNRFPWRTVLTEQDTIVVADFQNLTGEPVFDGALEVALAVALEQSPFLKVFSEDRVRETLQLMQRPSDQPVTRAVAREIAQREQLKAVLAGSISKLGSSYVIAIEAINAQNGDTIAREQLQVASKEEVLGSLGTAVAGLRETLGESLTSVARYDVPLPRATTSSLEALQAYSLALDQGRLVPREEAIPHLERALELDPDFALAHALLSGVYRNIGRSTEAPVHSRRAFELRDRVSERERFFISWRYYLDALQAWDRALDVAESWTKTYPREAFAQNSLGLATGAFGLHERAVPAFREAIRLDSHFAPPYGNLLGSLIALNRFDEADAAIREQRALGMDTLSLRRSAYLLAFLRNDPAGMARELTETRGNTADTWSPVWEGRTSAFKGELHASHDHYQRAIQRTRAANLPEVAAQAAMEDAETHAIFGQCDDARREVSEGLAFGRDNFTLERAARTLAVCDDGALAAELSNELRRRFPEATLTTRIHLPVIAAAAAIARRQPEEALEQLQPVDPYSSAPAAEFWPPYLRGQAYLQLGDGISAATQFREILAHRGQAVTSPLFPLAQLGLARAAVLQNDTAGARQAYEAFLALWNRADPDTRPLRQGKEEYAKLR